MRTEDFEKILIDFIEEKLHGLIKSKRAEYAHDIDVFHNFKKSGRRRGNCPEEALMGMKDKHSTSIDDMVQQLNVDQKRSDERGHGKLVLTPFEAAKWKEKIGDEVVYNILLWGLINERLQK